MELSLASIVLAYIFLSILLCLPVTIIDISDRFKKPPHTFSNHSKTIIAAFLFLAFSPLLFPFIIYFRYGDCLDRFRGEEVKKKDDLFTEAQWKSDYKARIAHIETYLERLDSDPVWSLIKSACESIRLYQGFVFRDRDSDTPSYDHDYHKRVIDSINELGTVADERAMRFLILVSTFQRFKGSPCDKFIEQGLRALGNYYHRDVIKHLESTAEEAGDLAIERVASEVLKGIKKTGKRPKKWRGFPAGH